MRRKGYIVAVTLALLLTFTSINQGFAENGTINPQAQIHFKNGIKHSVNGQLGCALNEYLKAIQLDPLFARAYNNLGYIYRQQGKVDLAITYYNKTLELNPKDDTAHTNLASAYEKKGDYDKAIEEFHKALKIDPGSITVELALEKIIKKKAQAESRTIEEVQAEVAALYPEEKTAPSYNKYLDLLSEEENEEVTVTETATETIKEESVEVTTSSPEKILDPIYSYDEPNTSTETTSTKEDITKEAPVEMTTTTKTSTEKILDTIYTYTEPETSEQSAKKENQTSNDSPENGTLDEIQTPLESSNADNKIEQILSDPAVGALMVLYKQ